MNHAILQLMKKVLAYNIMIYNMIFAHLNVKIIGINIKRTSYMIYIITMNYDVL